MVNWTVVKITAFLAFCAILFTWHIQDRSGYSQKAVEHATSVLNAKYEESIKQAAKTALIVSKELQDKSNKDREKKDEQIHNLNVRLDDALSKLRTRPYRPTNPPDNSTTEQTCTARGLYREDAEFLTREAARAESILVERDYYYNEYEKVRKQINGTRNSE